MRSSYPTPEIAEGPPVVRLAGIASIPCRATHSFELLDLSWQPIRTYATRRDALEALWRDWPPRTVVVLRRWEQTTIGPILLDEWFVHYDLGRRLRRTRIESLEGGPP